MKNLLISILLTFLLNYSGHSGRVISSFDIARWYFDSDLVYLAKTSASGFVIDYQTECDEGILKFIAEINEKGESYIFRRE
jgi:hypothetical protein